MVVIELKQLHQKNDVCNSYGIDSVWGLGEKIQSSSWLLEKYLNVVKMDYKNKTVSKKVSDFD